VDGEEWQTRWLRRVTDADHGSLPHMTKTDFDPLSDFTWIINLTGYTFGVVIRADSPWKTWQEFIGYARANPGKLSYGTPGAGTSLHITMEDIAARALPSRKQRRSNAAAVAASAVLMPCCLQQEATLSFPQEAT
jgi:tripartite-type tricarboxylate transporter receptor subunit TctC